MDTTWIVSIISLIVTTVISSAVGVIVKRAVEKKMDKSLAEQKELAEYREERDRRAMDEAMTTTIRTELQPLHDKIDAMSKVMELSKEGTITLLRESMKRDRDKFMERGFATASEVASWHELYGTYKKLGGNHFIEYVNEWRDDVDKLPREHKEEHAEGHRDGHREEPRE